MPSLGADMEAGFLREWKVKPGDVVKRGDIIAEVETQKGIIEIEIFDEGTVMELLIKVDEKVPVGTPMAVLAPMGETVAPGALITERKTEPAKTKIIRGIKASPLAKKIAVEKGIDLSKIKGSGPDGVIHRADVERAIAAQVAPVPKGKVEQVGVTAEGIRAAVAAAMSRSNSEIPHYYLETKVDMGNAQRWLAEANKERSVKDRLLSAVLLIKSVARALQEVPDLNAYWINGLQRKEEIHIGFVVSLRTGGVIIPTLHNAGKKSLDEIMRSLSDLIVRARALRLRSSELSDSTITISSLGDGGVEKVYGIIYPPQVALVGFGGIHERPWSERGMLDVRPVMDITLSADHRATDGVVGSRFLTAVKKHLTLPEQL